MGNVVDRLKQVVDDNQSREFVRGEWDCTIFCFEVLRPDFLDLVKGKYNNRVGAMRLIADLGGIEPTIESLGGKEISTKKIRTGDLVKLTGAKINENGEGDKYDQTLGIFNAGAVLCVQKRGMIKYPKSFIEKAWRFD